MTANEANKKIRELVKSGNEKGAGQVWFDYIFGETLVIEAARSTRSAELRHAKLLKLGIVADSQSRFHGRVELTR